MGLPTDSIIEESSSSNANKAGQSRNRAPSPLNPSAARLPTLGSSIGGASGGVRLDKPIRGWEPCSSLRPQESAGTVNEPTLCGYVRWGESDGTRQRSQVGSPEDRANWFSPLDEEARKIPTAEARQAETISELMQIRAFHCEALRRNTVGTALGFRIKDGQVMTRNPAIVAFVSRKVHEQWLLRSQLLPAVLHGPGGVWCDVDVVEFSFNSATQPEGATTAHSDLADGLRGANPKIGPGSQVSSEEALGTLGVLVRSKEGNKAVGFLTNHHVAVDFDQPRQLMHHPFSPSHGPGVYLGAVARASSFASDLHWYGTYSSRNPETFVRADGAFVPFQSSFSLDLVTTAVQKFGPIGSPVKISMDESVGMIVGRRVAKAGRSSGLTYGTVLGYAVEYHNCNDNSFLTDFLILGDQGAPFDTEGDSGSAILLLPAEDSRPQAEIYRPEADAGELNHRPSPAGEGATSQAPHTASEATSADVSLNGPFSAGNLLPRPVGIIWGGTSRKWTVKLRHGRQPENWTSGVDLVRLLELLGLEAVASEEQLKGLQQEALKRAEIVP